MGQITRLIKSDLAGGSGTEDVYPILCDRKNLDSYFYAIMPT